MNSEFEAIVETIYAKDRRYKEDAYVFVMEALAYTQKKFNRPKHVKGEEMLIGLRELLLEQFGPMTMAVLNHWGIRSTEDFGNIVFNLVASRVLSKTEDDNIEEFRNGYDFDEAFDSGYRKQLAKKLSRMRSI